MNRLMLCVLLLFVSGCAAMQWAVGDTGSESSPESSPLGWLIRLVLGAEGVGVWVLIQALVTKRGRRNAVNLVRPDSGLWGTYRSFAALLMGRDEPASARFKRKRTQGARKR